MVDLPSRGYLFLFSLEPKTEPRNRPVPLPRPDPWRRPFPAFIPFPPLTPPPLSYRETSRKESGRKRKSVCTSSASRFLARAFRRDKIAANWGQVVELSTILSPATGFEGCDSRANETLKCIYVYISVTNDRVTRRWKFGGEKLARASW